ncbi:MAG: membrane protein insertase YidC [Phycisphaera sp.]|nr:membrane protein insertase YidC [Phycisphaera sp.]
MPAAPNQPDPIVGSADFDQANPDANPYMFEAQFTPWGGGVKHILLSRYSTEVDKHDPYPVQEQQVLQTYTAADGSIQHGYFYPMAAESVLVNGKAIDLRAARWTVDADRTDKTTTVFTVTLANDKDAPVLRITRVWKIAAGTYDLTLTHAFENLTTQPLDVRFTQQGQVDLPLGVTNVGDRRTVVLCYLQPYGSDANKKDLSIKDYNLSRTKLVKTDSDVIWPGAGDDAARDVVWSAVTNRYFAVAVHPAMPSGVVMPPSLESDFNSVRKSTWTQPSPDGKTEVTNLALHYDSVPMRLAPKGDANAKREIGFQIFAGPKAPDVLKVQDSPYQRLGLDKLIIYNLGGMCSVCTFSWLADAMMWFFTLIHALVADWGVSIIVLVALVRGLLHPITKGSQINMQKMSKQMQQLQPEMERLKEKYADNPQKLNQETMKLYQEKGVNPLGMGLGCLPMFLQTPIWIALYAVLFFAIELRHQPAFYGVFQAISGGHWGFMADLSSQDRFITIPHVDLWIFHLDSINLLPLLWGILMFINMKYTTPQVAPANDNAAMQQKMMKGMMLLFPFLLYKAPCGLTLYILASTSVGIIESRRVRAHMKELEASGEFDINKKTAKKDKKPGFFGSLIEAAQQRMEDQQKMKQGGANPGPIGERGSGKRKGGGGRRSGRRGK